MIKATRRLAFEEIPIIDIGALANKERSDLCIESLRTACADVGFFYIKSHGFPSSLITDLRRVSAEFFSLPMSRKMNFKITPQIQGYLPLGYRSYEGATSSLIDAWCVLTPDLSCTGFFDRSKSSAPTCASIIRIRRENAGWDKNRRLAASINDPVSITAKISSNHSRRITFA